MFSELVPYRDAIFYLGHMPLLNRVSIESHLFKVSQSLASLSGLYLSSDVAVLAQTTHFVLVLKIMKNRSKKIIEGQ